MKKGITKIRKLRYRKIQQSERAIEQARKRATAMLALSANQSLSKRMLCGVFDIGDRTALDLKDKVRLAKCLGIDIGEFITERAMQKAVGERALDVAIIEKASQASINLAKIILCTTAEIRRALRITLEEVDDLSAATLKARLEKYCEYISLERKGPVS